MPFPLLAADLTLPPKILFSKDVLKELDLAGGIVILQTEIAMVNHLFKIFTEQFQMKNKHETAQIQSQTKEFQSSLKKFGKVAKPIPINSCT